MKKFFCVPCVRASKTPCSWDLKSAKKRHKLTCKENRQKICELEAKKKENEDAKLKADKEVKKAEEALKGVKDEVEDVNSRLAHQEDVKKQRENLEKKTAELQESSKHLESLEEELETFKREKEKAEDGLKAATEKIGQVKAELEESRGEVTMLNLTAPRRTPRSP